MNRPTWLWLVLMAFFLVGCASTSSTATVNADGSWSRTLKLTTREAPNLGGESQEKKPDIFAIPTAAEWTKSEENKEGEKSTILKRTFTAGEGPVTDIVVKDKNGTKFKNFVVVRKLDGNRIEYYEKIVMVGPKPAKTEQETQTFIKEMKDALPAGKATDEDLMAIGKKTEVALTRLLFGPDDHLFGSMLTNIDGTVRRIRSKIGTIEGRILAEQFGSRLSQAEIDATVKKLLAKFDSPDAFDMKKTAGSEPPDQNDSNFIGMSVAVKLPGKVVETNGEIDSYTGEVFWDFLSNSAEPDVLELRAICQL